MRLCALRDRRSRVPWARDGDERSRSLTFAERTRRRLLSSGRCVHARTVLCLQQTHEGRMGQVQCVSNQIRALHELLYPVLVSYP